MTASGSHGGEPHDLPLPDAVKQKLSEEEKLRRPQIHARKINLLLDPIVDESGQPYPHPVIEAAAENAGYSISRTRWTMLKSGRIQVVPDANRLGTDTEPIP